MKNKSVYVMDQDMDLGITPVPKPTLYNQYDIMTHISYYQIATRSKYKAP